MADADLAEQIRLLDVHALRAALKRLGGWPVIEKNWTAPNTSIEYLLGKLTGEFDEPGLVELYVGADDKNSSMNIIQVRPGAGDDLAWQAGTQSG